MPMTWGEEDNMIEKIKELYYHYSDQIITWYDGLEQLYQYGVFFLGLVAALLVVAFIMLSRITR